MSRFIQPFFGDLILSGIGLICLLFVLALIWDLWRPKQQTRRRRHTVKRSRMRQQRSTSTSLSEEAARSRQSKTIGTLYIMFRRKFFFLLLAACVVVILVWSKRTSAGSGGKRLNRTSSTSNVRTSRIGRSHTNQPAIGANKTNIPALPNFLNLLESNPGSLNPVVPVEQKPVKIGGGGIEYVPPK